MKTPQLVPSWLTLEYPITKYAQDANAGIWWDITKSDLTTPERALAASLRWRWHALNHQSEKKAGMIPNEGIRNYTIDQVRRASTNAKKK